MPNAITAIFGGDSRPLQAELLKAEIIGKGFAKTFPNAFESGMAASFTRLKAQFAIFDNFKTAIDKVRGHGMMSAKDSDGHAEQQRQIAVEAATRSNLARKLWRERGSAREADATAEGVDAAKRSNQARQLWRERKSEREAEAAADAVEAATRSNLARKLWRERGEMRAAELAAEKEGQLAMLSNVARSGGVGSAGGGGHGSTGVSGIVGETLVLMREMGRGNWSRVPGSITILAQRMGILGTVIKSTAAASVELSAAANKSAAAAAREALMQEAKAKAAYDSAIASGEDAVSAAALTRQNTLLANSARAAAVAEAEKAEAALAAAETEAAAATISMGPIGWAIAAVVALGVAAYFVVRHYKLLAEEQRDMNDLMTRGTVHYKDQAEAMDRAAEAARNFARWLAELNDHQESLADKARAAIDALHEQSEVSKKLVDAQKEQALAEVDLREKQGAITHREAIKQKAAIEKQAIADSAKAQEDALVAESNKWNEYYYKGVDAKQKADADVKAAESAANEDPAAVQRQQQLASDRDKAQKAAALVTELEKNAKEKGLKDMDVQHVTVDGVKYGSSLWLARKNADELRGRVQDDENSQTPADAALDKAKKTDSQVTSALEDITKAADKANQTADAFHKSSPALVAQQQATIDTKLKTDLLNPETRGNFGLNSQQRLGAYATTPPWMDKQLSLLGQIAKNTAHGPASPQIPGKTPPTFGDRISKAPRGTPFTT